jgi:hypothetical protein
MFKAKVLEGVIDNESRKIREGMKVMDKDRCQV